MEAEKEVHVDLSVLATYLSKKDRRWVKYCGCLVSRDVCSFIGGGFLWNSLQNSVLGTSVHFTEKSLGENKLFIENCKYIGSVLKPE